MDSFRVDASIKVVVKIYKNSFHCGNCLCCKQRISARVARVSNKSCKIFIFARRLLLIYEYIVVKFLLGKKWVYGCTMQIFTVSRPSGGICLYFYSYGFFFFIFRCEKKITMRSGPATCQLFFNFIIPPSATLAVFFPLKSHFVDATWCFSQ